MKYVTVNYLKNALVVITMCLIGQVGQSQTLGALHTYQKDSNELQVEKGVDLKHALGLMEQRYNVVFLYRSDVIEDLQVRSTLHIPGNMNIKRALTILLAGTDLEYKYLNPKTYGVYVKDVEELKEPDIMEIYQETVRGTVVDAQTGESLPGVNIIVMDSEEITGSLIGTQTALDGTFSISVPENLNTLVFSFIGYETREVQIDGRSEIEILMTSLAILADELVVVGYGAVQRRDMTGSVSSVDSREVKEVPVTSIEQALQGRAAGVVVSQNSGLPGPEGTSIRIRGNRSLTASNQPLYVVDGVPVDNIDNVAPGDIGSMEILKDGSAAAIYGARGANGVVLVTTTRGGDMPTTVSYNLTAGYVNVWAENDMWNAEQYMRARCDGMVYANQYLNQNYSDPNCNSEFGISVNGAGGSHNSTEEWANYQSGVDTDWKDVLTQGNGFQQDHTLSVRGGNESTQFSISGNFLFDEGVVSDLHDYQRTTFRLNLDHSVNDRLRVGTSTSFARTVNKQTSVGGFASLFSAAELASPVLNPYNDDGSIRLQLDPLIYNPLLDLQPNAALDETQGLSVFSNMFAEYNILENLTYRLSFAPNIRSSNRGIFYSSLSTIQQLDNPVGEKRQTDNFDYTVINQVNYNETFSDIHALNFTGVFEVTRKRWEFVNLRSQGMPYETQLFHNLGSAPDILSYGSDLVESGLLSWMGRVNYSLMDKYNFTFTGRYDGSSRFAEGNRFGFFPSIAVAWRIIGEPFLADQSLLSDLRLRASYGQVGNQAIAPYSTRGNLSRTTYTLDGNAAFGYRPNAIANPDLKWETSASLNLGLDFGLWGDRVVGSVEVYEVNTTDLLLSRQLPGSSGFSDVTTNLGQTRNRGWEFSLKSRNIATQNFNWTTDLNFFSNREEIIELYGEGFDDVGNGWFIGQPLNVIYNYEFDGIWQADQAAEAAVYDQVPGEIRVVDQNGDGKIDGDDRVILGQPNAKFNFGFNNRFSYKGLDLSVFMFGQTGHLVNWNPSNSLQVRYNNIDIDYWSVDNPSTTQPAINLVGVGARYGGTQSYHKGDFFKIRNIQLGYTIPQRYLDSLGIQSLRLQGNVTTPFVFHNLPKQNIDPERVGSSIPTTRTYQLGINIEF